jgi:hypothetical protein
VKDDLADFDFSLAFVGRDGKCPVKPYDEERFANACSKSLVGRWGCTSVVVEETGDDGGTCGVGNDAVCVVCFLDGD